MSNPHLSGSTVRHKLSTAFGSFAVLAVHGRNQSPQFMQELLSKLGLQNTPALLPAAAGQAWYPEGFMAPLESNQPRLDQALKAIDGYVDELISLGFSRDRVVLLGFSQGACLVSQYALQNPGEYRAIIAFTGGYIGPKEVDWNFNGDFKQTPVYITTSEIDEWVPPDRVRESADEFSRLNAQVTMRIYSNRPHEVCDEEIDEVKNVLTE